MLEIVVVLVVIGVIVLAAWPFVVRRSSQETRTPADQGEVTDTSVIPPRRPVAAGARPPGRQGGGDGRVGDPAPPAGQAGARLADRPRAPRHALTGGRAGERRGRRGPDGPRGGPPGA